MAIQKEIWTDIVQDKLYAGNEFINNSISHDAFISNKTVHIPQSGTIPAVQKDRSVLPATISQRTDTDRTYNLGSYTTDPILIQSIEELQTSYNKIDSVIDQHIRKINDRLGLEFLYNAAGATLKSAGGQIVLTTGTATASVTPPSGTGNRKSIKLEDIGQAAAKLDADDVSREGRYLMIPSVVYWDMLRENYATLLRKDYMNAGNLPSGIVAKIYDFNIITRSYSVVYADAATPTVKAVGAATATTDMWGCLGWQSDTMARALGTVNVFSKEKDPTYYGDILNVEVMFAAKALRTDGKGIVTIVQDS